MSSTDVSIAGIGIESLKRSASPIVEKASATTDVPAKKAKLELTTENGDATDTRKKGVAPVKAEYILAPKPKPIVDDDAAESRTNHATAEDNAAEPAGKKSKRKKERGQNKKRKFQFQKDVIQVCNSVVNVQDTRPETWQGKCTFAGCKLEHDLGKYLKEGKREDLEGTCPVWEMAGECGGRAGGGGWKCRWLKSHVREIDGGYLELVVDEEQRKKYGAEEERRVRGRASLSDARANGEKNTLGEDTMEGEICNVIDVKHKAALRKKQWDYKRTEVFLDWMSKDRETKEENNGQNTVDMDNRAAYVEPPVRPEEKRPLNISPDFPVLAPLTTTGNQPFRRLCVEYGAGMTYSEMAMAEPIIQGAKSEFALLKAHETELPNFGVQLCAAKPWQALKATEAITGLLPSRGLAFVDLNCGCPIDLVYQSGAGSALLDQHGKLLKMLKGMNYVSGETPVTVKIRMGCRDNQPTALKLVKKLVENGDVAAITLHGRSRQQRYTRAADWSYISETATLIKNLKAQMGDFVDTAAYKEKRDQPQATASGTKGDGINVKFIGNGDCYSGPQYHDNIRLSGVDSVMLARGALIKPWIFEEIKTGQYLDKSASERLDMIGRYAKMGLAQWGSDEYGVGTTRRFLLEWLSFTYRYVPIGILEHLPPNMQDRPPLFRGRNDLETLLASGDYRDWVTISEMFLGKAPDDFKFVPKHKSNSYEAIENDQAEG